MVYRALRPLLFAQDAEHAHERGTAALRAAWRLPGVGPGVRRARLPRDPALAVETLGLRFASPLGLAAGFDKDARLVGPVLDLGFGFLEVGTVTPEPQPGNPRPRMARSPADRALVNALGFNNQGMTAAAERLAHLRGGGPGIVAVNVGKGAATPLEDAAADYARAAARLAPLAGFVVVNVSSPNTKGLRSLQDPEQLRGILTGVQKAATGKPVLVKVAPDLSDGELDDVVDLALELELAGMVCTNTTIDRAVLADGGASVPFAGGGVSGAPLKARSLEVLRRVRARAGDRLVLIGAGGIEDADDAWARIRAGATLLEAYTGFVYGGPTWPAVVARGLSERARAAGFTRVQDAVGSEGAAPNP